MTNTRDPYAINVRGLYKNYNDSPVLENLHLTVEWGEVIVILGANGSGKTTLLKILSAQTRPEYGTVVVDGRDTKQSLIHVRRNIGFLGHDSFLYADLTCWENLLFFGRMFQLDDLFHRARQVLEFVGISDKDNSIVRTLSNGMQKRLSIARTILHSPRILLLDEPETGLDEESIVRLGAIIKYFRNQGCTIVMTTHDVDFGFEFSDRIAVLSAGEIAYIDSISGLNQSEFMSKYRNHIGART